MSFSLKDKPFLYGLVEGTWIGGGIAVVSHLIGRAMNLPLETVTVPLIAATGASLAVMFYLQRPEKMPPPPPKSTRAKP